MLVETKYMTIINDPWPHTTLSWLWFWHCSILVPYLFSSLHHLKFYFSISHLVFWRAGVVGGEIDSCRAELQYFDSFSCDLQESKLKLYTLLTKLTSKLAKNICIVYRKSKILPIHACLLLYNTLILPYLICCNIIVGLWGNWSLIRINKLFLV